MLPGARRAAVNVIYLMAASLNLEIGTPSFAVLMMDRFMSAPHNVVPPDCVLLVAMTCLNMAG
jgi:hypothetical protein